MKMQKIIIFLVTLIIFNCSTSRLDDNNYNGIPRIDLDTLLTSEVIFENIYKTHKNLNSINKSDTLAISNKIISIKTAEYMIDNFDSELIMSSLRIYNNELLIFKRDSILTSGMISYDSLTGILIVPIIDYQNPDDFSSECSLYIVNTTNGCIINVENKLINSFYSISLNDINKLLYTNGDTLKLYDIDQRIHCNIMLFDNPSIRIFKMNYNKDILDIYFYRDFVNDIINDNPMLKTSFEIITRCQY